MGFRKSGCIAAFILAIHDLREIIAEERRWILTAQILDVFGNFIIHGLAQTSKGLFLIMLHYSAILLLAGQF